jgi:hypothetical protein
MKKNILFVIGFTMIFGMSVAQGTLTDEEKVAAYVRERTEQEVIDVFNNNGYKVNLFIKGYPACMNGYVFYAINMRMAESTDVFDPPQKVFAIEDGKIISAKGLKLSTDIAFTLTAKDLTFGEDDCIIFIGTNGWAYVYDVYKFDKDIPMSLTICALSFYSKTLTKTFAFAMLNNEDKENNTAYDFSTFALTLDCKEVLYEYEDAYNFSEGLAPVKRKGKWGYINIHREVIIPTQYDNAYAFSEGLAQVQKNGKWGFVDKSGKEVIPLTYDASIRFSEGLAAVKIGEKWGFIDKTGKEVIDFKYDDADVFAEGLVSVALKGKYGFIDKTGNKIIPMKYVFAYRFTEGLAGVKKGEKWGFIDKTGEIIITPKYANVFTFSEGLAMVRNDGEWKWGFINHEGKVVLPLIYDSSDPFSEGLTYVRFGSNYGFIDKNGSMIIAPNYHSAGSFHDGMAFVKIGKTYYFIDKNGNTK